MTVELKRAISVAELFSKKHRLFDFEGEWCDAFDKPERVGVWFIWGNSGNGKSTFVLSMAKYLAKFERVIYNSREEGASHTMQKTFKNLGMSDVARRITLVNEPMEEFSARLLQHKSPNVAIIDSFQYMQLTYKDYIRYKELHRNKLLIFVSHADGKQPAGRAAKSVMYDAGLKIWLEGYKAISKGRYIGATGEMIIWPEGAVKYWGLLKEEKEGKDE